MTAPPIDEDDDEDLVAEPEGDEDPLDDEADDEPPPRRPDYASGHRQTPPRQPVAAAGPSPWERPRENFTSAMNERVPEMRQSKQASYVKGVSREA